MKTRVRRALVLFVIILAVERESSTVRAEDYIAFIDISASMKADKKLSNAGAGLNLFAAVLQDDDTLTVIAFNDSLVVHGPFTMATDRHRVERLTSQLDASGGTDYLQALKAMSGRLESSVGVFLSDGAHHGRSDEVLEYVERNLAGDLPLHTIAVGCAHQSAAEQLLSRMAAATDASYSRVESSENLVRCFLNIALRSGNYRGYQPSKNEVTLSGLQGTLLSFAYDGKVNLSSSIERNHLFTLPGENVNFAVSKPPAGEAVLVSLIDPASGQSRLGAVYTDGLPQHWLEIENRLPKYPPGSTIRLTLKFLDPRTQREVPINRDVSASIELTGQAGAAILNTNLQPVGSVLQGTLKLPEDIGAYSLMVRSQWPVSGMPFTQTSETTVVIEVPPTQTMPIKQPFPKNVVALPLPETKPQPPSLPKYNFEASKNKLQLTANRNDVARFELTIRPLKDHTGATALSAEYAPFIFEERGSGEVLVTLKWHPSGTLRGTKGQAELRGSILCPSSPGTCRSTLTISGRGESVSIPIELTVK